MTFVTVKSCTVKCTGQRNSYKALTIDFKNKNVCNFVLCGHNHSGIRFFSWDELLKNLNGKIDCAGDLVGF